MFKQDLKDINHVYNDNDMLKDEFRNLCKETWKKPQGFVIIDLTSDISKGNTEKVWTNFTYRRNKILFCIKKWKRFLEKSRKIWHRKIHFN